MALNFDVGQGILQDSGHGLVQDFNGLRFQFCAAGLEVYAFQFHTGIVKHHRNATRTCRRRHVGRSTAIKRSRYTFAVDCISFFAGNVESDLTFCIRCHGHSLIGVVLSYKCQLLVRLRHILVVRERHCKYSMSLVGQ